MSSRILLVPPPLTLCCAHAHTLHLCSITHTHTHIFSMLTREIVSFIARSHDLFVRDSFVLWTREKFTRFLCERKSLFRGGASEREKRTFLEGKSRDFTMREREKHNCSIYLLSSLAEEEVLLVRNIV